MLWTPDLVKWNPSSVSKHHGPTSLAEGLARAPTLTCMIALCADCEGKAGVVGDPLRAAHCCEGQPKATTDGGQIRQIRCSLP